MWHWDQGRLAYFQFDALRQIAGFVKANDFKTANRAQLLAETGLTFQAPPTHSPWRNYSRILKICLLVSEINGVAQPTPVADVLSQAGVVTCDEYLHFLVSAFTEPSPALKDWRPDANFRYSLLFSLKYLLTKVAIGQGSITSLDEIIGAYKMSGFDGSEDDEEFISIMRTDSSYKNSGRSVPSELRRQALESLKVISQISYLHIRSGEIIVTLNREDALNIFKDLFEISGPRANDREAEIQRLASLFRDGSTNITFDYPNTIVEEVVESGFREGSKVKKTHVTIERNTRLRKEFFLVHPTATCDVCSLDTAKTYPWTERIVDLHHLLPLSSGTRVEATGTTFDDLVPVCPNCHRAIHRFYDVWLDRNNKKDFKDTREARAVYQEMKHEFSGLII
ncbi:hypothetical protein [Microcoleus sp. Pol10D4]|uniref:hypothetical protein n=1 Tax=Microcoleus sp. Pol10D4 TaxID=3055387 RepID=UPI002FCF13CA